MRMTSCCRCRSHRAQDLGITAIVFQVPDARDGHRGRLLLARKLMARWGDVGVRARKPKGSCGAGQIPVKETKAQRSKRLQARKKPMGGLDEVRQFAREGRAACCRSGRRSTSSGGASTPRATAWAHRRQGRRRQGHRIFHDAHRHSQRHRSHRSQLRAIGATSRASTRATWPTSPCARTSSCTGSPSSRCRKSSMR